MAPTISDLSPEAHIAFNHVADAYVAADPKLATSASDLFTKLKGLSLRTAQGQLENSDAALLELADIVVQFSEIELLQRQAKEISREVIQHVRSRVAHTSTIVPASEDQLRHEKGLVVSDLLEILSLSPDAYQQLKAGAGPDTVKTLSRLQRFCIKRGWQSSLSHICGFKAQWDSWRTIERHFLSTADYLLLDSKARDVLSANLEITKVVAEAADIAKQFESLTAMPLTTEHVLGLIFSIAAEAEALSS